MAEGEDEVRPKRTGQSTFSRMARNFGWLAGSRGFTALISLAYLAVAARALRPEAFGAFTLILTYGQLIANLVQFQSWKGVIRYGALHVASQRPDRLERLFGFTATLDIAGGIVGAVIAVLLAPIVGPLFGWTPQDQLTAAVFGAVLLLTTGATASGMLRLFDRFDLLAYTEAVGPLICLGGSIAAWLTGGGVITFLSVWALAAFATAASQWIAAVVINRSRLSLGRRALKEAVGENERLWKFMLQTNLSSSLSLFWLQLGTLGVGAVAGAAEAGAFRLAKRLAKGIVKPVHTVTLALYPELARLVAEDNHSELRSVVTRVTIVASVLALIVVLITAVAGREILYLFAGKEYEFAAPFLLLLSIATAIDLAGFAFEPLQNAHGRSWKVLQTKLIAAAAYAILLAVLLPRLGGQGAAIAAIACSVLIFIQLALATISLLSKGRPRPEPVEEPL